MIGKQLEVDIEGKWRLARIIQTDRDENGSVTKYLVKFSKYPQVRRIFVTISSLNHLLFILG